MPDALDEKRCSEGLGRNDPNWFNINQGKAITSDQLKRHSPNQHVFKWLDDLSRFESESESDQH